MVGPGRPPLVIAELSGNHNGSLDRALELVEAAARTGAHALKLQTYTADTITLDLDRDEFRIGDDASPWAGRSLYDLYTEASTPWEWHKPIFRRATELGLAAFSTPFDETAIGFLEDLDVPCYKIASFEIVHLRLIAAAAATGKPLIMSTGMASVAEIGDAVETAMQAGCRDLVLLKCTSTYPADPKNTNVLTIPHMSQLFRCQVGLSDHTMGVGTAVAAVAHGATLIEKHLVLSRAEGGVDAAFSAEPNELRALVQETERAWRSLGAVSYGPTAAEQPSLQFRRSLYVARDMKAGDRFTEESLRAVRPGLGLPPKFYDVLMGMAVTRDVERGTPVSWDMVGGTGDRAREH